MDTSLPTSYPGDQEGKKTAKARYDELVPYRLPFLQRAREASMYTLPSLVPPEGHSGATELYVPYQSVGADGVNNLASKMLLVLFPPGESFFRLTMDDFVAEQLSQNVQQQGGNPEDARAIFEEALSKIERAVTGRMEAAGNRKVNYETFLHLIVSGNALVYVDKTGKEKMYPLTNYVVKRDMDGNVLEIIARDTVSKTSLPPAAAQILQEYPDERDDPKDPRGDHKHIDLFTWVQKKDSGKGWTVYQELQGKEVPGTRGSYPEEKCAWIPLRWTTISNEDYGRGRCEEFIGDLRSFEFMSKALIQFFVAAAKVIPMVNPASQTNKEDLANAESGDFVEGVASDVTFLMMDKAQDFQIAKQVADETKQRLERAFLMTSAVQRQAERVTAEEIRAMVGELEQSLGGVYSLLAEEFQRPLVIRVMAQMALSKQLPTLPDKAVRPQIVTGLEGLGRASDLQKLEQFVGGVAQELGPQVVAQYVNVGDYLKRRGAALGMDITGLVRTDQEIQQQQQQEQMAQMTQKLGPAGIKAASDQALAAQQSNAGQPPDQGQQPNG